MINSIFKLCLEKSIKRVVIFSDEDVSKPLSYSLNKYGIETIFPLDNQKLDFVQVFIFIENASCIICNASTLVMSISFLFHMKFTSLQNLKIFKKFH